MKFHIRALVIVGYGVNGGANKDSWKLLRTMLSTTAKRMKKKNIFCNNVMHALSKTEGPHSR